MTDLANQLADRHNDAKEKFAYYQLGITSIAIGFEIANNAVVQFNWVYAILGISLLLLGLSFLAGLSVLQLRMKAISLNKEYVFQIETYGKVIQPGFQYYSEDYKALGDRLTTMTRLQGLLLVVGVLSYFAFLLLKSAFLLPVLDGTPAPQPSRGPAWWV